MKDLIARYSIPEPNSGCWLWIGGTARGYGVVQVNRRQRMATHISLESVGRPVPKGMQACHHCDVPACVNPDHLFIGSQRDNIHDCMSKGRNTPPPRTKKGTRTNALFCVNGHLRTSGNTYLRQDGYKGCRICARAKKLRELDKEKARRATDRSLRPPPVYPCGPDHMAGINLYVAPNGKKTCRACNLMAARRYALKALVAA